MKSFEPGHTSSNFEFDSDGNQRDEPSQQGWYRDFWSTYKMSDYLPLWIMLRTNNTDDYLKHRLNPSQ
jgi:hypothetical protein